MNLGQASIVVRPRGGLEVFDLAFRFARALGGRLYLRLFAVVVLPCWLLTLLLHWYLEWSWVWVWLVAMGLASIAEGPFTLAASRLMFSESVTVRDVLRAFLRRFGSFLFVLFGTRFLVALGSLVIFAAPFAWVLGAYVHEITLLEGSSGTEAFGRASRFARQDARRTVEMLLAHSVAFVSCIVIGESVGQGLVSFVLQLGTPFGRLLDGGSPYALAGYFAAVPLVATARFLSYIDARTRRDAWDVQVRFMAVAAEVEERIA